MMIMAKNRSCTKGDTVAIPVDADIAAHQDNVHISLIVEPAILISNIDQYLS